ncbi:UDP-N-acetylmuramate dehydrogenase [Candidatus Shapirobacteria bacterium]|nr:UDP-N-acetylmuramate dehydrogenase [Candidatus Shapirobacteria bacterium]
MKKKYQELIDQLGKDRVEKNTLLKNHTTFGIGGPADLFYETKTTNELIKAVKLARKLKVPYFLLGGGSNVLAADKGFGGLIIKNRARQIKKLKNNRLQVASGTSNQELVSFCQKQGLSGVEFLAGIPGTLGGAIYHNARFRDPRSFLEYFIDYQAVKDQFIGNLVEKVKLLLPNNQIVNKDQEYCQFSYASSGLRSVFKEKKDIILEITIKLEKADPEKIAQAIEKLLTWRMTRGVGEKKRNLDAFTRGLNPQPTGRSSGCIFSNVPNPQNHPTGRMIDLCGLKGKKIGGAVVSDLHANFIINENSATAKNVFELIKLIKKEVKKKFGVNLKEEIDLVGF